MRFRFDIQKAIEAAARIVELEGNSIGRKRLLKLLYISERELLVESARPLTGDFAVAMKHGPVLSTIYDLMKNVAPDSQRWQNLNKKWQEYFQSAGYKIFLIQHPQFGSLTKREKEKLDEVQNRFRDKDDDDLSDFSHGFEEWSSHFREGTSTHIPWQDMVIAQGKRDLIPIIEEDEADRRLLESLFG